MRNRIIIITIILLGFTAASQVNAQYSRYRFHEQWYFGVSLGSNSFYGDLTDRKNTFARNNPFQGDFYKDRKFMYGFDMTKRFNSIFYMRGSLIWGNIASTSETENMYFRSNMRELSISAMFNFSEIIMGEDPDRPLNVYGFIGIGSARYTTYKRDLITDTVVSSVGIGRDGKAKGILFPMGLGVNYQITDDICVNGEITLRRLEADNLDSHLDDAKQFEGYGYLSLGISYRFNMPQGMFWKPPTHNRKSSDPSLKAYNRKKRTSMQTTQHKKAVSLKKKMVRKKRQWAIVQFFKRSRLNVAKE